MTDSGPSAPPTHLQPSESPSKYGASCGGSTSTITRRIQNFSPSRNDDPSGQTIGRKYAPSGTDSTSTSVTYLTHPSSGDCGTHSLPVSAGPAPRYPRTVH